MFLSTEGILLKKTAYTGNGLILKVYTKEKGIKQYFARKTKKTKAIFQPLTILNITAYENPKKTIQNVKEVTIAKPYKSLQTDLIKSNICLFINELLEKVIQEEEPNKQLYTFLKQELITFDDEEINLNFHLDFLMKLTFQLGIEPDCNSEKPYFDVEEGRLFPTQPNHEYFFNKKDTHIFKKIWEAAFNNEPLSLTNIERKQGIKLLLIYYRFHNMIKELKSLPVLEMVFA